MEVHCAHRCLVFVKLFSSLFLFFCTAQPGCPDIKGKVGVCAELCSCDSDCRHGEKCCSNGCGHECMSTNPDKPGGCGPPWFSFLCGHPCHHDSDCPGQKKCCPTLCSFTCQEPHQPHSQPGCPDIKGKVGVCAELCSCDSDCRHGEKCCSNGCGYTCQEPYQPHCS
uniref:WAP domain-containing protein n=1 Tax=Fundulus heteroclitus TaxID=8078 RepID=A0A3Q2PMZ4_FUNHE